MSNENQQPQFVFTSDLPTTCTTVEQMKAVMKCRFQRALDEYFDGQLGHAMALRSHIKFQETVEE